MTDPTNTLWSDVANVVVRNLPDGISDRAKLLHALAELIPCGHPMQPKVRQLACSLSAHRNLVREFDQLELDIPNGSHGGVS